VLFWRTHQQREVDFVVPRGRDGWMLMNGKWTDFNLTCETSGPSGRFTHQEKLPVFPASPAQTLRLTGLDWRAISPPDLLVQG